MSSSIIGNFTLSFSITANENAIFRIVLKRWNLKVLKCFFTEIVLPLVLSCIIQARYLFSFESVAGVYLPFSSLINILSQVQISSSSSLRKCDIIFCIMSLLILLTSSCNLDDIFLFMIL